MTGSFRAGLLAAGGLLALWLLGCASLGAQDAPAPVDGVDAVDAVETSLEASTEVELINSSACGKNRQCHRLKVRCGGLEARGVHLEERQVEASRGTVVVATGVYGNKPYDEYAERRKTLDALADAGFEVFALRWSDGRLGWGSTAEGAGYAAPMCGYTAVVRWLVQERADHPSVVCAQGNSGAALQIAYGLSVYGLGDLLDVAVLTGGPPLVRIDEFCFAPTRRPKEKLWRANGRRITDYLMGWEGKGDYCKNGSGGPEQVEALRQTGLLPLHLPDAPPERQRLLDFPTSRLYFVVSEGDKSAPQARLFYKAVQSEKGWYPQPGRVHGIDREAPSAELVRQLLIDTCGKVEGADVSPLKPTFP